MHARPGRLTPAGPLSFAAESLHSVRVTRTLLETVEAMNSKVVKIILAVVLLAAAVVVYLLSSGGSSSKVPADIRNEPGLKQ